jgi:tungstate transport system ATP-binding protein
MSDQLTPIRLHELVYSVDGRRLIDGLSFEMRAGSRTVIMGPNGAGKSLTLRLLQGLMEPDSGSITWGEPPKHTVGRQSVSLVFQRPVLLRRTVAANLRHAVAVCGMRGPARSERVEELLAMGGLEALRRSPARVLSAGEQQRLSLVRALAGRPRVLLLDEPTANLDPASTLAIERLVNGAHEGGAKIVFVTHDRDQAARLADDVVFMQDGRAVETGAADRFFSAPSSEEARAYLDGRLFVGGDG